MFRLNAQNHLAKNPRRLGGPGKVVEMDESCVSGLPKHHRGRAGQRSRQVWVFGSKFWF